MNAQAQNLYVKMQVNTATPGELTLMLFNGSIKFMKLANEAFDKHDYAAKNENIKRTVDIIDELLITLNMSFEISKNLSQLYYFMKDKLYEANIKADRESLSVVLDLMTELRDTWVEAVRIVKGNPKASPV